MDYEEQERKVNVLHALQDAMDIVFKYLDRVDLMNAYSVCTAWRSEAQRELKKRRVYIHRLLFIYKNNSWPRRMVRRIPSASLFAYETSLEQSYHLPITSADDPVYEIMTSGFEEELLEYFKMLQVQNRKIVLNVNEYLTTEDEEFQVNNEQLNSDPPPKPNISGLFFFNEGSLFNVRVSSLAMMHSYFHDNVEAWQDTILSARLLEDLGLDKNPLEGTDSESMILIVGIYNSYSSVLFPILWRFFRRYKEACRRIKFASIFGVKLVSGNYNNSVTHGDNSQSAVLLRISGETVVTCSVYIHCLANESDIETKLKELKDQWQESKKYHVGLVYSLNCITPGCAHNQYEYSSRRDIMNTLKRIFPRIPFSGYFVDADSDSCPALNAEKPSHGLGDYIFDNELFIQNLNWHTSISIISYD